MIDFSAAYKTVTALSASTDIGNSFNTPMIPEKKKWKTQIVGAYDLIFPYLNEDFPRRDEVFAYIKQVFDIHHGQNWHHHGPNYTSVPYPYLNDISIPGFVYFSIGESARVRPASPVSGIGYNI